MKKSEFQTNTREFLKGFLVVFLVGLAIRIALFITYLPVSYNDTASYWRSAQALLENFSIYDGTRTPGYPAFLAIAGSERVVYILQLLMGLMISLVLFTLGKRLTGSTVFGVLAGIVHSLNAGQIFFEANVLTETLTTFWLALTFLFVFLGARQDAKIRLLYFTLAGLTSSLTALTRPLFIFLPVLLSVFLAVKFSNRKVTINWRPLLCVLIPAIILVGGWMGWVKTRFGVLNLSVMGGFHMVQHTGYYFEDVPEEDAILRDIYLQYRDKRVALYGTQGNTIWDAIPAMQEASGLNIIELSAELQRISIGLIKTHPWQYMKFVLKGWALFWLAPVYWSENAYLQPAFIPIARIWVFMGRAISFGSNLLFIVTSALALLWKKLRQVWNLKPMLWIMTATVWATSIVQTLLDHGDNPRFLVPLQSLVIFWVLWIIYHSWFILKQKRA